MAPVTNLRAGQRQLGETRKALARVGAGGEKGQEHATLNTEFIDETALPEAAAATRPEARPVLRAPTE